MEPAGVLSLLCFLNTEPCSVTHSGLPVFILPSSIPLWQAVEEQTVTFSFFCCFFFLFSFLLLYNYIFSYDSV